MIDSSIEIGVEIFTGIVSKAYKSLSSHLQKRDFIKTVTLEYIKGLWERNSTIKVLTMQEPRPLESLYVRVNILSKISAEGGDSAEELEKFFDRDRRAFGQNIETIDGTLVLNKLQRFIVLGKPGAGKTTYLRYLTLMMLNAQPQIVQHRLPIFVTLREWADKKISLMNFIVQQFDICGFEKTQDFVEQMLREGDCMVLFDGLDEVSQDADQRGIIQQIKDFCEKYSQNQFIISCRVAAYNRQFDRFSDVEMADFNEGQKERFIRNWFDGEPGVAERCWNGLQDSPQLCEMAAVPLLLTLLCIAYNRRKNFPVNRAELYEEAIDALLRDWDATRDIRRDEVYKHLSMKYKKSMFARIASWNFKEDKYFIPERMLTKQIENYIKNLPGFKPEDLELDSHAVLRAIEAQHGIFVERAKKVHSFAHLTFQEFFTAKHLVDTASEGSLEGLVKDHYYDDKWLEVFVLTAEMLDNADYFVLMMHRENRRLLEEVPELNELLRTVQTAILPKKSKYSKLEREWAGLNLAIVIDLEGANTYSRSLAKARASTRVRARALVRAFASARVRAIALALELALDLSRFSISDSAHSVAHSRALDVVRLEAYEKAHNLTPQIFEKITAFLTGNIWIAKCLRSGAYISADVREKVLAEMFQPLE
jgi:hypothetical protein